MSSAHAKGRKRKDADRNCGARTSQLPLRFPCAFPVRLVRSRRNFGGLRWRRLAAGRQRCSRRCPQHTSRPGMAATFPTAAVAAAATTVAVAGATNQPPTPLSPPPPPPLLLRRWRRWPHATAHRILREHDWRHARAWVRLGKGRWGFAVLMSPAPARKRGQERRRRINDGAGRGRG